MLLKKFQNVTRKFLWSGGENTYLLPKRFISCFWYNEHIKFDNNTIYNCSFSHKNLNQIGDLFENNGKIRSWANLRAKLGLDDIKKILIETNYPRNPCAWKEMFLECGK